MTSAQRVLFQAAQDARDYCDRRVHGRPHRGQFELLTIGRDLQEAIKAVEVEEYRLTEAVHAEQFEARR